MWLLQVPSCFFYSHSAVSVGSALEAWSCSEWLKRLFLTLSPCFQRSHLSAYCCLSATAKATETSLPGAHLYFLLALQYPTQTLDWCVFENWKGGREDSRTHRGGMYRHVLPETYWLQVNGQIVKCSSDLYPDCCWKRWGLSKTMSYASCVCFPGSAHFPVFLVLTLSPLITGWPRGHPDSPLVMQSRCLFFTKGNNIPALHPVLYTLPAWFKLPYWLILTERNLTMPRI